MKERYNTKSLTSGTAVSRLLPQKPVTMLKALELQDETITEWQRSIVVRLAAEIPEATPYLEADEDTVHVYWGNPLMIGIDDEGGIVVSHSNQSDAVYKAFQDEDDVGIKYIVDQYNLLSESEKNPNGLS